MSWKLLSAERKLVSAANERERSLGPFAAEDIPAIATLLSLPTLRPALPFRQEFSSSRNKERSMFPEYRSLISQLKTTHPRFQSLFEKHNELDHKIIQMETSDGQTSPELATMKKEKLLLKDEMYKILQHESQQSR